MTEMQMLAMVALGFAALLVLLALPAGRQSQVTRFRCRWCYDRLGTSQEVRDLHESLCPLNPDSRRSDR